MEFKSNKIKKLVVFILAFISIAIFFVWQNNDIVVNNIVYENSKIPKSFNEYKIAHVSDLHNKEFGLNQHKLLEKIEKAKPDIIVVTGDLIDSSNTNIDIAMDFINGAINIAPIFYVSGNHEAWSGVYAELSIKLEEVGVIILDNKNIEIEKDGETIDLIGMADPELIQSNNLEYKSSEVFLESLKNTISTSNKFNILLSHRPELLDMYENSNVDLVFSGHAHGGQVRLPFIGGLVAPDQGFFPKYTSGIHSSGDTSMIISRGLGNSIIPVRVFNRPELIIVTLKNQ